MASFESTTVKIFVCEQEVVICRLERPHDIKTKFWYVGNNKFICTENSPYLRFKLAMQFNNKTAYKKSGGKIKTPPKPEVLRSLQMIKSNTEHEIRLTKSLTD